MKLARYLAWAAIVAAALPVCAQASDIGLRDWGVRVGFSSDPDQVVGGVQFDLGEFRPALRFQPDIQLGAGDDHTTLFFTAPVHYRFNVQESFTPYVGGGISLGWVDRDLPAGSNADDSSFEIGARATGGLSWRRDNGGEFAVELSLGFSDVPEAQIVALWNFGK